jgi:hypothetical protein
MAEPTLPTTIARLRDLVVDVHDLGWAVWDRLVGWAADHSADMVRFDSGRQLTGRWSAEPAPVGWGRRRPGVFEKHLQAVGPGLAPTSSSGGEETPAQTGPQAFALEGVSPGPANIPLPVTPIAGERPAGGTAQGPPAVDPHGDLFPPPPAVFATPESRIMRCCGGETDGWSFHHRSDCGRGRLFSELERAKP